VCDEYIDGQTDVGTMMMMMMKRRRGWMMTKDESLLSNFKTG